ncbi:ribonuclease H2 subunit C, partial [Lecanoromycetidae sp. Uapishka_2]
MIRFSPSTNKASAQCTPNLLPCHIHHDGAVEASSRYWAPEAGTAPREEELLDGEEDDEEGEETGVLQEIGSFDEIILWGHESMAGNDDPFVKGMGEWTSFAEAMHKPGKP